MTHDPREALESVKAAILEADPAVVTDTLWMPERLSKNETVVDYIDAVLTASAPGEQQPVAWQFQAVNGKWSICGTPDEGDFAAYPERLRPLYTSPPPATGWDDATTYRVDYDGFVGTKIGAYRTREGREGVVLQQADTKIVHVYGANRVEEVGDEAKKSEGDERGQTVLHVINGPFASIPRTLIRRLVDDPNSASGKSLQDAEVRPSDPIADRREIVARIIDPAAFSCTPEMYGLKNQDELEKLTMVGPARRIAREKVTKILAALDGGAGE